MSGNKKNLFWISYSDLMTSLFFTMLVLFVVIVIALGQSNEKLKNQLDDVTKEKDKLERLLKIDEHFQSLSKSSHLAYDEKKCVFYVKDLMGVEIFEHLSDVIKPQYLGLVDDVGKEIKEIIDSINSGNDKFKFQLVIEGTAAIPYNIKVNHAYNPDSRNEYELSYKRSLALYYRWKKEGLNFRDGNTEIIIAGSGFNGKNRDEKNEDNNKRFVIQIIPKIARPSD